MAKCEIIYRSQWSQEIPLWSEYIRKFANSISSIGGVKENWLAVTELNTQEDRNYGLGRLGPGGGGYEEIIGDVHVQRKLFCFDSIRVMKYGA